MNSSKKTDYENLSDEELMLAYIDSDYLAFEQIYQRFSGKIYSYLNKRVSGDLASDLLQETFARIHKSRSKYKSDYPLSAWIFTILKNLLADHFKKNESKLMNQSSHLDLEDLESQGTIDDQHEAIKNLDQAFAQLSKLQQEVLQWRYLETWTFEEIAKKNRTTSQNARQLVSRALRKLKFYMQSPQPHSMQKSSSTNKKKQGGSYD